MEEDEKKKNPRAYVDDYGKEKIAYRISRFTAALMITIAALADLLDGFLIGLFGGGLIINSFEALVEYGIFGLWFLFLGIPYSTNVWRFVIFISSLVLEIIPAVNAGPFFVAGISLIIVITRNEDRHNKDYSLLTLATPKKAFVRASRISAQEATFLAQKQSTGKTIRQKRVWASNLTGKGVDASGQEFSVKYSLDKKATLQGLKDEKKAMAQSYISTAGASKSLKERTDDNDDLLFDDIQQQKARSQESNIIHGDFSGSNNQDDLSKAA